MSIILFMRYSKPKNIQKILDDSSIGHILRQNQMIDTVMERINTILPKTFRGYYIIKNYDNNVLEISVANAVIHYGFNSKKGELLVEIQKIYPSINNIRITINPNLASL